MLYFVKEKVEKNFLILLTYRALFFIIIKAPMKIAND